MWHTGHVLASLSVRLEASSSVAGPATLVQMQGQSLSQLTSSGVATWSGLQVQGGPGRHTLVFSAAPAAAANSSTTTAVDDVSRFPVSATSRAGSEPMCMCMCMSPCTHTLP
jgi:hypothetical protein